jgi:hypothetical protein
MSTRLHRLSGSPTAFRPTTSASYQALLLLAVVTIVTAGLAYGQLSAWGATSKPIITSFKATVSKLPSSGGSLELLTEVRYATSCKFEVSPAITGLPVTVACSSGSASRVVKVPANVAAAARTFSFTLVASGPGGTTTSNAFKVVQAEAPPAISAFTASPATLHATGGTLTLSGKVARATSCKLSASPALSGLPVTLSCSAGTVSRAVAVPANAAAGAVTYSFTLVATGPAGSTTSGAAKVVESEAAPLVSTFAASPSSLPSFGGDAQVTASVLRATTCELSVPEGAPAVTGLPVSLPCASGSVAFTAALPALATASSPAQTYSFVLEAGGPGGTALSTTVTATVYPTASFGTPTSVDAPSGTPTAISCASTASCTAVDYYGNALTWDGSTWSAPEPIDTPFGDDPPSGVLRSVSCPTTTFCAAVDQDGNVLTESGSVWSAPTAPLGLGTLLASVSCASATFCVALGGGQVTVYNGSTWASLGNIGPSGNLTSVSCPLGASTCEAVESSGAVDYFDGSSWVQTTGVDPGGKLDSVSCPMTTFCAAVDTAGDVVIGAVGSTSWSQPDAVDSGGTTTEVSCTDSTFCGAVNSTGDASFMSGSSWSQPTLVDSTSSADSISCPSDGTCFAVDIGGGALEFTPSTTIVHVTADPLRGYPEAVSCGAGEDCTAVDYFGDWLESTGSAWSAAHVGPSELLTVSCPSASFCAAGTLGGDLVVESGSQWTAGPTEAGPVTSVSCTSPTFCGAVFSTYQDGVPYGLYWVTWNGTTWSAPAPVDADATDPVTPPPGIGAISCLSSSFCVAVAAGGYGYVDEGGTWSSRAAVDVGAEPGLLSVSCATTTFCEAVDGYGQAFTFNGSSWSGAQGLGAGVGLSSVSCPAAGFCMAVDTEGQAASYVAGTWSALATVDPGVPSAYGLTSVSCSSVAYCVASDLAGNVVVATG